MSICTVLSKAAIRLFDMPSDVRLPKGVQKVEMHVSGNERIIAPVGQIWDSFFLGDAAVRDDFMSERASQDQTEREPL